MRSPIRPYPLNNHRSRRFVSRHLALLSVLLALGVVNIGTLSTSAAVTYSVTLQAADPTLYAFTSPTLPAPTPGGFDTNPLAGADFSTSVSSLAPSQVTLGQIVPFEIRVTGTGTGSPTDFTFTVNFGTVTTSGSNFGYDPTVGIAGSFGIYDAFVDRGDSLTTDTDATLSFVGTSITSSNIVGTFTVHNLDGGNAAVVEVWMVLDSTIPTGATGNVQATFGSGGGAQTVPLNKVQNIQADLTVTKTELADPVAAGQNETYTITVTNNGPSPGAAVVLSDAIPANTTFVSISTAPAGWTYGTLPTVGGTGTITATNPSFAVGAPAVFTVVVNVNAATSSGTIITNTATVSSNTPDPNTANNPATITATVVASTATDGLVSGKILDSNGNPVEGAAVRMSGTRNRLTITDANGNYHFDNVETTGFYTVVPSRANFNFNPTDRSFSQLGNHTDAVFTGSYTGGTVNPLDATEYFVRQQYLDFLNREPEEGGFTAWVNEINNCAAGNTACDRVHVSEMFFRSQEFQQRGYFVYRFYPTAFGRKPDYVEFTPDMARVSGYLTGDQLEAAKMQYVNDFMARPAFLARYAGMSNADYVDALINTAQVNLSNRQTIIDALNNGAIDRAHALRMIAESTEVYQKHYNQAFVVMEYFGYLRRDPDALYLEWVNTLNQTGDSHHMVNGFVNSSEYRLRFGP